MTMQQAPAEGGVRLTVRWPLEQRPERACSRSNAASAFAPSFACFRRRCITIRARGAARIICWTRESRPRLGERCARGAAWLDTESVPWPAASPGGSTPPVRGCWLLPAAMQRLPAALRLSEDDAVMLAAMVAGDRTYLTHALRVGFERTGSFHMLVVSGFHLAIVAGCIFWIARRLRLPRVPATLLTIAASFAYALFTGFATPVQRSLWMITLYLLGRLVYRERSPLNTIGFASLCLLVVSPRSLFDSSLQMTLLAVVAIAGVAAPLLQGTIHPYLSATRDLRLVAMDMKLASAAGAVPRGDAHGRWTPAARGIRPDCMARVSMVRAVCPAYS